MAKEIKWNKRFDIGVDSIDKAHRKLFSIVHKLSCLNENENNGPWACAEGIKYFKNYAITHFAEEEAYMQSIGYKGYEMHKRLHDDMRDKTLPALEKDLKTSKYSKESIHHFLGICLGWLTAHIMIEDRAITGKGINKWKIDHSGKTALGLESAISDTMEEIFKLQADVISEHYSGENFGESVISRLIYQSKEGKQIQFLLIFEEGLVLHIVNFILDMQFRKVDKLVSNTFKILSEQMTNQIAIHFPSSHSFELENSHLMTMEQLQREFCIEYSNYSFLFDTGVGYFAFCIKSV